MGDRGTPHWYKPTPAFLMMQIPFSLSPAVLGVAIALLLQERTGWWIWIPGSAGVLLALNSLISDVVVYSSRIILLDEGILTRRLGTTSAIPWPAVMSVALRERKNAVTRTDHLLLFKLTNGGHQSFCASTLPPEEEQDLLARIRERFPVSVFQDKPTL